MKIDKLIKIKILNVIWSKEENKKVIKSKVQNSKVNFLISWEHVYVIKKQNGSKK